ncbi:MAG: hypothetical protein MUD13_03595 [Candidatus Nanopelagicales bacterium]|jgi:hypothetical protein|nr:hypothetical protein [Candidatus Nanopelagicales bacterium]
MTTVETPATTTAPIHVRGWLGWFALAVIIGMQAGTIFKPLGTLGETRVADWVDVLTPYAVLGAAAMVLLRAGADRPAWILYWVGAITFTLGHGMHLAANSVSNVADERVAKADIVHLWDEVVSHWPWYLGLFLVMVAMAWALRGVALRVGARDLVVAALVTITLVNNYIEGGTPWLGLVLLAVLLVTGLRWRPAPVARLLLLVGGLGLLLLVGWGAYWLIADNAVFPQFSELGWI